MSEAVEKEHHEGPGKPIENSFHLNFDIRVGIAFCNEDKNGTEIQEEISK